MIRTRTRIFWFNIVVYIVALGVGFTVGRIAGLGLPGAFVLGGIGDVAVLSWIVGHRNPDHHWTRAGGFRL